MPGPTAPYGSAAAAKQHAQSNHKQYQRQTVDRRVQALRHFLISQGYRIPDAGDHIGPMMKSALNDWHSGVHKRDAQGWNKAHNREVGAELPASERKVLKQEQHQVKVNVDPRDVSGTKHLPKHNTPINSPKGHAHGGGGSDPLSGITGSLYSMLTHSNTARMLPASLADQVASPDTALAATLQDQINKLPKAKKQALQDISDWFGQVQTAEKKGASRDQDLANAGAAAMQDATKGIMASLGGSAMAGAGEVGAVGVNDANTMKAIGANDASLANELAPIFKESAAEAKVSRSRQYDNQLSQLQNQHGQALGQADADRAAALMQILSSNNASRQTNFGNATGLLNTLAGLQISGMNAASEAQSRGIMNALHISQIRKNAQKSGVSGLDALSPSQRSGLASALNNMIMDPNSGKLKSGMAWPTALQDIRNYLRTQGLNPLNKRVVNQFVAPILANAGIQFGNPNTIYRP